MGRALNVQDEVGVPVRGHGPARWTVLAGTILVVGALAVLLAPDDDHDLARDAVAAVYVAGDPLAVDSVAAASLPADVAQGLLADGPLDLDVAGPLRNDGEVVVEGTHAHVVTTADGTRWCVTETGRVVHDCMVAWQFASAEADGQVRAAMRLRHYPERSEVVLELVNDADVALDPTGGIVGEPFADAVTGAPTILIGPSGAVTQTYGADGRDWTPGSHVLLRYRLSADTRASLLTEPLLTVSWPWGTVEARLLETTWLLGPESEPLEDHDH